MLLLVQANLNQSILNLCDPVRHLGLSVLPGTANLPRMDLSTCHNAGDNSTPAHVDAGHDSSRYNNSDTMGHQNLRDDNVPAHNSEGYNFILNTASTSFYHSRDETQEDWQLMVVSTPWELVAVMNICFSKFLAVDSLEWYFAELTIWFLKDPLAYYNAYCLSVRHYCNCQAALHCIFEL